MNYKARILLNSVAPCGKRLTTWELCYPRFVHAEFMTHRMFSRNAASSRAIPTMKIIEQILHTPAQPVFWGQNQKGMQAETAMTGWRRRVAETLWYGARYPAVGAVWTLSRLGLHKQLANRLLEPWVWITVICSATEFGNFFSLRCHEDAQPEIHYLADMMAEEYERHTPTPLAAGEWHMPLLMDDERHTIALDTLQQISVARCARISYLTHDGRRDVNADLVLYDRLMGGSGGIGHWCYDTETEVLTQRGWALWRDVEDSDQLAAVDPNAGTVQFERPSALLRSNYQGEMYRVAGQQLDLLVTPNHRMVVRSRRSGGSWTPFRYEEAREVAGRPRSYLKAASLKDRKPWTNPWGVDPTTWAKFIGFFVGDGNADVGNRAMFHLRLTRKITFLKDLGLPYREAGGDRYIIELPGLGAWLRANCYQDEAKVLPDGYLYLTADEVEGLWIGLRNSDGSSRRNTWVYDSTSRELVDQIQALAHVNQKVVSVAVTERKPPQKSRYRLNFSDRLTPRVETGQNGRALSYSEAWEPYDGEVFCATVSTGALLVRRNGHVIVSGNSPFEHVAMALELPVQSGNFFGWQQYRKQFSNECHSEYTRNK